MSMALDIKYEDNDILVIVKPAGLATQTKKVGEKDLVSLLKKHLKGGYVGVIHRLDQPVEGLLVFAKNPAAAAILSKQIQQKGEGAFLKDYVARVFVGKDKKSSCKSESKLTNYIIKTKENVAKIIEDAELDINPDAKKASLTYEIIGVDDESVEDAWIVELLVHLETGRFHQIRAQLSHAGMPILGDRKYGSTESIKITEELGIKYVALCAKHLSFNHPKTGKVCDFELDK